MLRWPDQDGGWLDDDVRGGGYVEGSSRDGNFLEADGAQTVWDAGLQHLDLDLAVTAWRWKNNSNVLVTCL